MEGVGKGDPSCLYIPEVEKLVPGKRRAQRGSELVLMVRGNIRRIPVLRVKSGIADVFPHIAVYLVGSRLDAGVDHGAGRVAELRAVVGGADLEFSQSVWRRRHIVAGAVLKIVDIHIVIDTVQDEVVLGGALAIGKEVCLTAALAFPTHGR